MGAGVAGGLCGWTLARAGHQVVVLEAGPPVDRAEAVARFRNSVSRHLNSPYPVSKRAPVPTLDDWESHYRQEGPELFSGVYQRVEGGSTWHWLGTALRLLPEDFQMNTRFGLGVDWPVTYRELEPWYTKAEIALGVSGDSTLNYGSPRDTPYPMPAIQQAPVDGAIQKAIEVPLLPLPQARNSRPYDGRPRCCGSASCIPICPIGAKYDATVHLKKGKALGMDVRHDSPVLSLKTGPGSALTEVEYLSPEGTLKTESADQFIVAAHSVETARLLLSSGLANGSGEVGQNLMGGSAQLSWALSPEPVYPYGYPQATSAFFHHRGGPARKKRAGFLCSVSTDGWPGVGPEQVASRLIAEGLKGVALRDAVRDHVSRQVALVSTCEQLPNPENRVSLAVNRLDALGVPRPAVRFQTSSYTKRGLTQAEQFHQTVLDQLKATEVTHSTGTDPAYLLGTTRMGNDPARSVVDPYLRSHEHQNLWVVGPSVFPTSGTAPPTLTVAALALRTAHYLSELPRR